MVNHKELKKKLLVPQSQLARIAYEEKVQEGDFRESVEWRIFRIMAEFIDGFHFLGDFKKSVTFFGSARLEPDNAYYQQARKLAFMLSKEGFAIFSGGGPGIMEAANLGAFEAKGESVGLNIQLKFTQRVNDYITKAIGFHYFFTRKLILSYSAQSFVFFPGGYGTMDEFFEIITLIQTQKIPNYIPVICVGKEYWSPLMKWIKSEIYEKLRMVDKEDLEIYQVVDTVEEAYNIVHKSKERDDIDFIILRGGNGNNHH